MAQSVEDSAQPLLSSDQDSSMNFQTLVAEQRDYFLTRKPTTVEHRLTQLKTLRKVLLDNQKSICDAVGKDLGRSNDWTYALELSLLYVELDYFIANVKKWSAPTCTQHTHLTCLDTPFIYPQPKGVVLVIGPWNYPLNTLIGPLLSVLAAGNTAVVKPSEGAPHIARQLNLILTKVFERRYLAVVECGVKGMTELLKQRFDHIMFTGSAPVGRVVMEAAAKHLTPVTLELGGKSPAVVLADADIRVSARRLAWGKFTNCGQTCVAPDYILVTPDVKDNLVAELIANVHEFYGLDVQKSPDYSRIINARHFDRLMEMLQKSNGKVLFKGGAPDRNDLFIPPIIIEVGANDSTMQSEIFGPIFPILTVNNFDEAVEFIRSRDSPLALYLFTRDERKMKQMLAETTSGSVAINDTVVQFTVDTLPFGGVGKSGMGRYRGKFGFDEFSHQKAVLKRGFFGDGLLSMRYAPMSREKVAQIERVLHRRLAIPDWLWYVVYALPILLAGIAIGLTLDWVR